MAELRQLWALQPSTWYLSKLPFGWVKGEVARAACLGGWLEQLDCLIPNEMDGI